MTGGSTNAVLHLLAIAHEAGIGARYRRLRSDQFAHSAACRFEGRAAASWQPTCTRRAEFRSSQSDSRKLACFIKMK